MRVRHTTQSMMDVLIVVVSLSIAVRVGAQRAGGTGAPAGPSVLSPEELTSVRSVVGGGVLWAPNVTPSGSTGAPMWAPDGSRIMFGSSLAGSDLWTVPSSGGPPTSLNIQMHADFFYAPPAPTYSPDGKWIAYVSNRNGGAAELYVHSLEDSHEVQLTHMGAALNSYSWSPDGRSIAFADRLYGHFNVFVVTVANGAVTRLTSNILTETYPAWTPDGKQVVYLRLDDGWLAHDVLAIDAQGKNAPRPIVKDTAFFDYGEGGTFGYPQVSPDGSTLMFRSHRSGWINYWVVPLAGGTPRQIAAEPADQGNARWSPDGKSILYTSLWNGTQDLRVVPAAGGAPRVLVKPAGMGVVANAAWSPDGTRVSYTTATPVWPADLYVIPAAGGTPTRLTTSMADGYIEAALIRPKKVAYPSTDGLTIHAYLYEPILKAGEKAPGILLIHGGPTSQVGDTYQLQAQYFAMRGYAVLLPNNRGSSGYGKAFEDANNGCWGRCDLKDVAAGVAFLKQQPYIEPTRMGITGQSYGGCMSIAATAFAPGLFQASISISGYGDWVHFYNQEEYRHIKLIRYELGPMPESEPLYRSLSAINYIDSIQTPMFLIQGTGKPGFVSSEAARTFADRLEMRYKPYRFKAYPNEYYYIRSPANMRLMLVDMQAFFDQYLKDDATHAGAEVAAAAATR